MASLDLNNSQLLDPTINHSYWKPIDPPILQKLSYLDLAVIPVHISNIALVAMKQNLHENPYYFLVNLSVSDIFSQVFVFLIKNRMHHPTIRIWAGCFYTASIFFTLAINIDRYLKVKYGLRYYEIVVKKPIIISIIVGWLLALAITFLPLIQGRGNLPVLIFRGASILGACALLVSSAWIRRIRNKHSAAIAREEVYFQTNEEKKFWERVKKATKEVVQLSWMTSILILAGSSLHITDLYARTSAIHLVGIFINNVYGLSNPFVYMFVMRDLRKHYIACFRHFCHKILWLNHVTPRIDGQQETDGTEVAEPSIQNNDNNEE